MSKITRRSSQAETLEIANCPRCNGEVSARDCGYTTFNPGMAECTGCKRKWSFGCVSDAWEVGLLWNGLANKISNRLKLLNFIGTQLDLSRSRDFTSDKMTDDAKELLIELEDYVTGSDKITQPRR